MAKQKVLPVTSRKTWLIRVAILWLAATVVYTVLAFVLRAGPIVIIDESLYTNIARSLAWEGKIAYRGQPIDYPYLLYPMLLVPLYWLQSLLGGDIYRWIQVFNAILICSSVIPAFLFGADFCKDDKKGFLAAIVTALMPDMLMAGLEITEAVLWPLALWVIWLAWKKRGGILMGVLTGLMFAAKPGAVAMGAMIMLWQFVKGFRKNQIREALRALIAMLAVIVLVYAVYVLVFGYHFSLLGLYDKQTSDWEASHALVALEGVFLSVLLFAFACCGYFFFMPYLHLDKYDNDQKNMILAVTAGLAALLIGTAVMVVPYCWEGDYTKIQMHLRYVAMYLPLWFIFTQPVVTVKETKGWNAVAACFGILCIFPGIRAGLGTQSASVDALSLSAFIHTSRLDSTATGWILTGLTLAFILFSLFAIKEKGFGKLATGFMVLTLVFNNVCACINLNVKIEPEIAEDAIELNDMIRNQKVLGIMQRDYNDVYSYWEEAHLTKPMEQVTIDQMIYEMNENNGVYQPFVPIVQAPNVRCHETADTNVFVLAQSIAEHLEMNESVVRQSTANGIFTVAEIQKGERWVDTMLYGMQENVLYPETDAILLVFGSRSGAMTLRMQVYGNGTLTLRQGSNATEIELNGNDNLEINFPTSGNIYLNTTDKIEIRQYSTVNQ